MWCRVVRVMSAGISTSRQISGSESTSSIQTLTTSPSGRAGVLEVSCRQLLRGWFPIPGQQLVELAGGMAGDAGQHVGEPCLRVDVVELGGRDQAVEDGGALAGSAVGRRRAGLDGPFRPIIKLAILAAFDLACLAREARASPGPPQ